jgi:hypothetical protein
MECKSFFCVFMFVSSEPEFVKEPKNRFQGINSASICSLAGRYDNPIPTWFPAPIDCSITDGSKGGREVGGGGGG